MNWKDIAFAPKDGTFVDIWVSGPKNKEGCRITDAYFDGSEWMHGMMERYGPYKAKSYVDDIATHFMFAPEGPK